MFIYFEEVAKQQAGTDIFILKDSVRFFIFFFSRARRSH